MNRLLSFARRARYRLHLAAAALTILATGCAHYRVIEIDTTSAEDFRWDGKVRITERIGGHKSFREPRRIVRIELCGEDSHNVVIRPAELFSGDRPAAAAQYFGMPPDRYVARIREAIPEYQRAWESMVVHDRSRPGSARHELREWVWTQATAKFEQICKRIDERDFESVSGADLAFVCAFRATQLESIYELDEHTIVRVRIEDDSLLDVTVEDTHGNILHGYRPTKLPVTEIEPP